ncbi:unnamed protein product [Clonostachys chloroleuca]|uniref:Uncharacterized protein n=1 Tax=Clonostachys chloroleuca TaxID=1926264 RepID=A0AA35Q2W6_9HYPO|nr:unnamed protein product [Clonostachys chloroleuca]
MVSLEALPVEILTQVLDDCCFPCESSRHLSRFIALRRVSRHFDDLVSRVALPDVSRYALGYGPDRTGAISQAGLRWLLMTKIRMSRTDRVGPFALLLDSRSFLNQGNAICAEDEEVFLDVACRTILAAHDARWIVEFLVEGQPFFKQLDGYKKRFEAEEWVDKSPEPEEFYGALQIASTLGDWPRMESLIKGGVRADYVNPLFGSAARVAISLDYLHIVQGLVRCGHDPNARIGWNGNRNMLLYAGEIGRRDIMEFLLTLPEIQTGTRHDVTQNTALFWAAERGWTEAVRLLLSNPGTEARPAALEAAVKGGHEDIVRLLVARDDLNPNFGPGRHCPLWLAAKHDRDWAVKLLLDRYDDVDPNIVLRGGKTMLILAAKLGHISVVRALLERDDVDPNFQALGWKKFALHYAAAENQPDVVEALLESPSLNLKATYDGMFALEIAVYKRHLRCARLIFERMDKADKDLEGALMLAVRRGSVYLVRLFRADAQMRTCLSYAFSLALCQAALEGATDMVMELVKYDEIDPNRTFTTCFSREDTALFAAVRRGHVDAARLVLSHTRLDINHAGFDGTVLGLLADRGDQRLVKDVLRNADLDVNFRAQGYQDNIIVYRQDSDEPHGKFLGDFDMRLTWDDTPLLRAARKGFFISVRIFLEDPRTDVCATGSDQRTALWWAVHWNRESMVRRLLEADNKAVNMRDVEGWTPLHLAVNLSRSESMLRLLLKQQDVDPNITTEAGWTALHLAMLCCDTRAVEALLDHPEIDTSVRLKDGRAPSEVHAPGDCDCKSLVQSRNAGVEA